MARCQRPMLLLPIPHQSLPTECCISDIRITIYSLSTRALSRGDPSEGPWCGAFRLRSAKYAPRRRNGVNGSIPTHCRACNLHHSLSVKDRITVSLCDDATVLAWTK